MMKMKRMDDNVNRQGKKNGRIKPTKLKLEKRQSANTGFLQAALQKKRGFKKNLIEIQAVLFEKAEYKLL